MEDRRTFIRLFLPRLIAFKVALLSGCSVCKETLAGAQASETLSLKSPRYVSLIGELVSRYHFDKKALQKLFQQVQLQHRTIEKLDRPPERLPYHVYRSRFLTDTLIASGKVYMQENRPLLQSIEEVYGVEGEIIAGILGIETKFGERGIEKYRVWDSLNTLFSLYPRREAFFRREIIEYLLLCREEAIDPASVNGSYSGAIGVPQFMPSSFRAYAVDQDKDGKRDLWRSKPDIFASVGNYLKTFGWKKKGLIRLPAQIVEDGKALRDRVNMGTRKTISVAEAERLGLQIQGPVQKDDAVSFVFYAPEEGKEALLALFDNFRGIMRYNISVNYALVVTDLAEILRAGERASSPVPSA